MNRSFAVDSVSLFFHSCYEAVYKVGSILNLLLPEGRGIGDTTDFLVNTDDSGINA